MFSTKVLCLLVLFGVFGFGDLATFTVDDDNTAYSAYTYKDKDDLDRELKNLYDSFQDSREKHLKDAREKYLKNFRDYGVPPDVAQVYMPQGKLTIGDVFGKENSEKSEDDDNQDDNSTTFDPWSIVWYIGSFGGLIAFFLVVSCSEWCCIKSRIAQQQSRRIPTTCTTTRSRHNTIVDTPPPSYDLFAPPSYESITYDEKMDKLEVFVVPVHGRRDFVNCQTNCQTANSGSHFDDRGDVPPPEYSSIAIPAT